jgi:hypothetical protein
MYAADVVLILAAVSAVICLPAQTREAVAVLIELGFHWWFWVLVGALYFFGLIPGTSGFAIRRAFQALDRMRRQSLGLRRRPSWAAIVWLLLLAGFTGRYCGWWG